MGDRFVWIPMIWVLAALFQGCSGEDALRVADGDPQPVFPLARVEGGSSGHGAASGFADGEDVFRLCAFLSGNGGQPADWSVKPKTEAFENEPVDVVGGVPVIRASKYYPPAACGKKLWFYAYAPATGGTYNPGSGGNSPAVDYIITGKEDIMAATVADNGICSAVSGETQRHPSFRFRHLLKRVTFKLVKGEGFASDINASAIRITGCRTKARLDIVKGTLTFEGEPTASFQVTGTWAIKPSEEARELPNVYLMCEPGPDLTVEVVVAGVTYRAKVNLDSPGQGIEPGAAGVSHLLTLTFKGTQVEATGSIVPWEDVGEASGVIN